MTIQAVLRGAALSAIFSLVAMAASIDGKWTGQAPGRGGEMRDTTYEFKADGATLTGKVTTARGDTDITEGKIDGAKFSFKVVRGQGAQEYSGEVAGDELKMKRKGGQGDVDLTAKRVK